MNGLQLVCWKIGRKTFGKDALELYLTPDAFLGHLSEELKVKLERKKCDLVVIPCGVTSQLQPRNISVNVPFKDCLINGYEAWFLSENLPLTPSGKIRRASASKLAKWLTAAWKKFTRRTVNSRSRNAAV
jgi:hypothetical protein